MTKPWEQPSFLSDKVGEASDMPTGLDGIVWLISRIRDADEWRRKRWKQDHPGFAGEIDKEINQRSKNLDGVLRTIDNFRGNQDQEEIVCVLLMAGIKINMAMHSWTLHAAEKGVSQEAGLDKSKKNRGVSNEQWKERQVQALEALNVHGNRKKVSKELGISPRQLAIWLNGGKR